MYRYNLATTMSTLIFASGCFCLMMMIILTSTCDAAITTINVNQATYSTQAAAIASAWTTTTDDVLVLMASGTYAVTTPLISISSPTPGSATTRVLRVQPADYSNPLHITLASALFMDITDTAANTRYELSQMSFTLSNSKFIRINNPLADVLTLLVGIDGNVGASSNPAAYINARNVTMTNTVFDQVTVAAPTLFVLKASYADFSSIFASTFNGVVMSATSSVTMFDVSGYITGLLLNGNTIPNAAQGTLVKLRSGRLVNALFTGNKGPTILEVDSSSQVIIDSVNINFNVATRSLIQIDSGPVIIKSTNVAGNTAENGITVDSADAVQLIDTSVSLNFQGTAFNCKSGQVRFEDSVKMSLNIPLDFNCDRSLCQVMYLNDDLCYRNACKPNIFGFSNFDSCFSCPEYHPVDSCISCNGSPYGPPECEYDGSGAVLITESNDPVGRLQVKNENGEKSGSVAVAQLPLFREMLPNGTVARVFNLTNFPFSIAPEKLEIASVDVTRITMKARLYGLPNDANVTIIQDFPNAELSYNITEDLVVSIPANHLKFTFKLEGWAFVDNANYLELVYRVDAGAKIIRSETTTTEYNTTEGVMETSVVTHYSAGTSVKAAIQRFALVDGSLKALAVSEFHVDDSARDYIVRFDGPFTNLIYDPDIGVTLESDGGGDGDDDSLDNETLTIVLAVILPIAALTVCLIIVLVLIVAAVIRYMVKPVADSNFVNL